MAKKQSYVELALSKVYKQMNEVVVHPAVAFEDAIRLLGTINDEVIAYEVAKLAKEIDVHNFNEHPLCAEPEYGYEGVFRGEEYSHEMVKKIDTEVTGELFWQDLGMCEYWMDQDVIHGVRYLPNDLADEYDLTILCDTKDDGYGSIVVDLPEDALCLGNTKIMSQEDWDKLEDAEYDWNENSNLVWHEVSYTAEITAFNLCEELDDRLSYWLGDSGDGYYENDGLLGRLQHLHDDEDTRLQALIAAGEMINAWANKHRSVSDRMSVMHNALLKFEDN